MNQFGKQTLVRMGAYFKEDEKLEGEEGKKRGRIGGAMRQIVNIQGTKQMSICLCFSWENATVFPVRPGQDSATHRREP